MFVPGIGSESWDSARCVFLIVNEMEAYFFRALDRFFLNLGGVRRISFLHCS